MDYRHQPDNEASDNVACYFAYSGLLRQAICGMILEEQLAIGMCDGNIGKG